MPFPETRRLLVRGTLLAVIVLLSSALFIGETQGFAHRTESIISAQAYGVIDRGKASSPSLTSFGQALETVVFAAVTYEGVCSSSRHGGMDWRGSLPRFIARQLRPKARVLVWNGRASARNSTLTQDCEACMGDDTDLRKPRSTFACSDRLERHGRKHADLVVVIGTGAESCKDCDEKLKKEGPFSELKLVLKQTWVGPQTVVMHMPISRDKRVLENQVAKFDSVIQDGSWIKPISVDASRDWKARCHSKRKDDRLVYVARYHSWKGQVKFLKLVDPEQLRGYTVEFFSGNKNSKMTDQMHQIATERGIKVIIHTEASNRTELMSAMCSARGAVHYARTDANPRAVYEALMAHLPVLITKESRVPRAVLRQPFVEGVQFGDQVELALKMEAFMKLVGEPDGSHKSISKFISEELDEEVALAKVCAIMGICRARHKPKQ